MIGIGISTYNDFVNTDRLITSILRKTTGIYGKDYVILVIDDGTREHILYNNLVDRCNRNSLFLLRNEKNMGIAYTWNRLTEWLGNHSNDINIIILLNNDLIIANNDWLKYIKYFLDNNEDIGTVGFPLINPPDFKLNADQLAWDNKIESRFGDKPGRCGAPVGCSFGFKKDVWKKVINSDKTIGFWESTVSFHEETQFGFKLWELGYRNYMLPWPPIVHYGGQTFSLNRELRERMVNWNKIFEEIGGTKDEYINTIRKSKLYPSDWPIVWNKDGNDYVDRMAFSRYMFSKYWNVLDYYDNPAVPVHNNILRINEREKKLIKWLDKNGTEKSEMI